MLPTSTVCKGTPEITAFRKTNSEVRHISTHFNTYRVYMTLLDKHLIQKKQKWYEMLNDDIEEKNPRSEYSVLIYSTGVDIKTMTSEPILAEIERCTKITREKIESLNIIKDKNKNDVPGIQINVNNFKTYKILRSERSWPKNAFKTGVEIEVVPPKLYVIINNIDLSVLLSNDELLSLEAEYGLIDIKRIPDADGNETRKLRAGVKTVWHFVNAIRKGVRINWRKRRVQPDLRRIKPCLDCGSLRHNNKKTKCTLGPRCILCSNNHHSKTCQSLERRCLNWGSNHATNDTQTHSRAEQLHNTTTVIRGCIQKRRRCFSK